MCSVYQMRNGLELRLDLERDVAILPDKNVINNLRMQKHLQKLQGYYNFVKHQIKSTDKGKSIHPYHKQQRLKGSEINYESVTDFSNGIHRELKSWITHRIDRRAVSISFASRAISVYPDPFKLRLHLKRRLPEVHYPAPIRADSCSSKDDSDTDQDHDESLDDLESLEKSSFKSLHSSLRMDKSINEDISNNFDDPITEQALKNKKTVRFASVESVERSTEQRE